MNDQQKALAVLYALHFSGGRTGQAIGIARDVGLAVPTYGEECLWPRSDDPKAALSSDGHHTGRVYQWARRIAREALEAGGARFGTHASPHEIRPSTVPAPEDSAAVKR